LDEGKGLKGSQVSKRSKGLKGSKVSKGSVKNNDMKDDMEKIFTFSYKGKHIKKFKESK
jgi:hypothetical protein